MSTQSIVQNFVTGFDQTRIHYSAYGDGPALVCTNALGASASFYRHMTAGFQDRYKVVTWDYRGHGLSFFPDSLKNVGISVHAADLLSVLDDLKIKQAVFVGHRSGVQVVLEQFRRQPQRVAGLVLIAGGPGHIFKKVNDYSLSRTFLRSLATIGTSAPSMVEFFAGQICRSPKIMKWAAMPWVNGKCISVDDLAEHLEHLGKLDAELFFSMLKAANDHTAEDLLSEIHVPTLLIAGKEDCFTPKGVMAGMHAQIQDSELMVVPGATHAILLEQPDQVRLRMEKFFRDRIPGELERWLGLSEKTE